MRTSRRFNAVAVSVTVGLLAGACGGDDLIDFGESNDSDASLDGTASDAPHDASTDQQTLDSGGDAADSGVTDAATDAGDAGPKMAVVGLALGQAFSCALLEAGEVWCWGANAYGELGTSNPSERFTAARVPGLPKIVAVAAGSNHTCALDEIGAVYCWGQNAVMQLGHDNALDAGPDSDGFCQGNAPCSPTPRVVAGLGAAKAIFAAGGGSCAELVTGEVKCWGENYTYGFLGHIGGDDLCLNFSDDPCNFVPSTVGAIAIDGGALDGPLALGALFGCFASAGSVSCWGTNQFSALDMLADTDPHPDPVAIGGLPAIVGLGGGDGTAYAVTSGGALYSWGWNSQCQTGSFPADGGLAGRFPPVEVLASGVVSASGGSLSGCALLSSSEVSCWGSDLSGETGSETDGGGQMYCQPPQLVPNLTGVSVFDIGDDQACAIKMDHTVWCWGDNRAGQLGHDPASDSVCPSSDKCDAVPTQVTSLP